MFLSFGIRTGCIDVSPVPKGIINLLGASLVLFEAAFVTLPTILFPTKSPVNFAVFWISLFWCGFECICCYFSLCCQEAFIHAYCYNFCLYFLQKIKIHSLWYELDLWVRLNISLYNLISNNWSKIYPVF